MPEFKQPRGKKRGKYPPPPPPPPAKRNSGQAYKNNKNNKNNKNSGKNNKNRKSASYETHRKKIQANVKKGKQNNIIYYCMFAFIFVVLVSVLSVTVLFNVQEVLVEGKTAYPDTKILEAADIPAGVNLIRYDVKEAEQRILDKLVYIDSAKIRKDYPSKLTVMVTGAEKMASILLSDGQCLVISKRGRILENFPKNNDAYVYPIISGYEPKNAETGAFIESAEAVKTELIFTLISEAEKSGLKKITGIDITDHLSIVLDYDGRIRIAIGPATDLKEKMTIAKGLVESEISENETGGLNLVNPQKSIFTPNVAGGSYEIFENELNSDGITSSDGFVSSDGLLQ